MAIPATGEPGAAPGQMTFGRRIGQLVGLLSGVAVTAVLSALAFSGLAGWLEGLIGWWASRSGLVTAFVPAVGATLAVLVVHRARTGPATADAYVLGLQHERFDVMSAPARALSLVLGVGCGAPLGYEGPAVYFGGAFGAVLPQRRGWSERPYVLAAATAAVAVVIDAPIAAALFAVEVARRGRPASADLVPVGLGAGAAWVVGRALAEPTALLGVAPGPLRAEVVVAGAVLGLVGGAAGRGLALAVRRAKALALPVRARVILVGGTLAIAVPSAQLATGEPVLFGSGHALVDHAGDSSAASSAVLLVVFAALVVGLVAGGVVGGLFLPMLAIGSTLGLIAAGTLLSTVASATLAAFGAAAMLSAAYGCPMTAVALAASRLGWSPELLVAVGAVVLARSVAGPRTVSLYQS